MVTDILNKMAEIVANNMIAFQSDFEKYDKEYIIKKGVKAFPFCGWYTGRTLILFVYPKSERITLRMRRFDMILHNKIAGFTLICGPDAVRLLKIFIS